MYIYIVISQIPVRPGWPARWNGDLRVCHGIWVSETCIGANSVATSWKIQWYREATTHFELSSCGSFMDSGETRFSITCAATRVNQKRKVVPIHILLRESLRWSTFPAVARPDTITAFVGPYIVPEIFAITIISTQFWATYINEALDMCTPFK